MPGSTRRTLRRAQRSRRHSPTRSSWSRSRSSPPSERVGVSRFQDKVVVITGAAGGIGRAAARRFASEGASVVLVDLSAAGLEESRAAVESAGGTALTVEADVTKATDVR